MDEVDASLFDHNDSIMAQHAEPGIMLFTASIRLLYKNRRAWELCQHILRGQDGKAANGILPPAVASLANEVRNILQVRKNSKDVEQLQLRHVVYVFDRAILLCGNALIDSNNSEQRILIVMHETGIAEWREKLIVLAKQKFQLTACETTVVQHLLKGWTNKEIANAMKRSEQTVKEHCKHILEKTRTTTRTGIVMQVVQAACAPEPAIPPSHMRAPAMPGNPVELLVLA
jgi:DNA-binding CsgD family transcriptional regulator